jgi:hypothetical protein
MYGRAPVLAQLDQRPGGPEGDREHELAVAQHAELLQQQHVNGQAEQPEGHGK